MYLTSQRVQAGRRPDTGINVLLYKHDKDEGIDWTNPNVGEVTSKNPGTLVARETPIRPGGNRLLSFLDVLAPDDVTDAELAAAFEKFSMRTPIESRHWTDHHGRVSVRFFVDHPVVGLPMREFLELSEAARKLFKSRPALVPLPGPLTVTCTIGGDGIRFALDAASQQRLVNAPPWRPASVSLEHATRAALAAVHPDYLRDVALVLTGLDEDELGRLGGVRFVVGADDELIRWPLASPRA